MFALLKSIHLITVAITLTGFLTRSYWMLADSPLLQRRWVKIFPHVNDTVLLTAALGAAWASGQYPFVDPWLTAKLGGVVVYILLGGIALTYGRTKPQRVMALVGALATFAYIIAVAICRSPTACLMPG